MDRHAHAPSVIGLAEGQSVPTILVVDDLESNRDLLRAILEGGGLTVVEATDGEQAIRRFEEIQPDLIFMDVTMQGLDGLEATQRIRAAEAGAAVPIVAVSAGVFEEDRRSAFEAGVNDFISKPIREQRIWDVLEDLLSLELMRDTPEETVDKGVELTSEAVAALGADLVGQLSEMVQRVDMEGATQLVADVEPDHPEVASGIRALLEAYNYDKLSELLQGEQDE